MPHPAIVPVARRVRWIESDTRQGLVRAVVTTPDRIDISTRWARTLMLYLHDRIVNLDRPITVTVNGVDVFTGVVKRSAVTALEEARRFGDERRITAATLTVHVPITAAAQAAGEAFSREMAPARPEGTLSFWEMFATRALDERWPSVGFEAVEEPLPEVARSPIADQVALRVTAVQPESAMARAGLRPGDVVVNVGGEPFFRGRGLAHLHKWLQRELRGTPQSFAFAIVRAGTPTTITAQLQLGPYAAPSSAQENRR